MNFGTYAFSVPWNPGFTTAYDTLPAPNGPVRCSIRRGRASDLATMSTATCALVVQDKDGVYNPANASSPLVSAGYLRPMRKLTVTVTPTAGSPTPIFTGYLTRLWAHPGVVEKTVEFEFVDGFRIIEKKNPVIASTGIITAGAGIDTVLTAAGITAAGDKDLDAGGWLPDLRADGSRTAIDIINEIALIDQGAFFVAAGGKFTYRDRSARYGRSRAAPVTTINVTGVEHQVPGFDVQNVVNEQSAQAQAFVTDEDGRVSTVNVGEMQSFAETSYLGYVQGGGLVSSPFFRDANQAFSYALHVVTTRRNGDVPTRDVRLPGLSVAQVTQQVALEISAAVTLTGLGITSEGLIESISHDIVRDQHVTDITLTSRPGYAFTVGVSTVGSATDLVRY